MKKFILLLSLSLFVLSSAFSSPPIIPTANRTVFITEIADPNNNDGARFIELYNSTGVDIDFSTGWAIQRATNGYTYWADSVLLTGIIKAGDCYVVCANQTNFTATFGFAADQSIGSGGPADSNGDDQLRLLDNNGDVADMFGLLAEDGSGTNHEFEDGRAERKYTVTAGSPVYVFAEWNIWNDTGGDGTTNDAQDAPGDFDPGTWIGIPVSATAPVINDVVPVDGFVAEVDSVYFVSATVSTTDPLGLDTVMVVFGFSEIAMTDTFGMTGIGDDFIRGYRTDSVVSYYGQIIAINGSGETTKSDIIEIVSVNHYKPIIVKAYPSVDTVMTIGDELFLGAQVLVDSGSIDEVFVITSNDGVHQEGPTSSSLPYLGDSIYAISSMVILLDTSYVAVAVVANDDTVFSDYVKVTSVCGSYDGPVAMDASEITTNSFVANWGTIDGADTYALTVWTEEQLVDIAADGTGTVADPFSVSQALAMPESATDINVKGYIVGRGSGITFGSPATNDYSIVLAESAEELDDTKVLVVQLETEFRSEWGLQSSPEKYKTAVSVQGYRDLYGGDPSIEGLKSVAGIVALTKDTVATYELDNETSKAVVGLDASTTYKYSVKALGDVCNSDESNVIVCQTSLITGVLPIMSDVVSVTASAGLINVEAAGECAVEVYDIMGRKVKSVEVNAAASICLERGVYLVRVADTITKVAVQ